MEPTNESKGNDNKGNESIRERLLSRLPQSGNLEAYREEVASLLARHEKALFWERFGSLLCAYCAVGIFILVNLTPIGSRLDTSTNYFLQLWTLLFLVAGVLQDVPYRINRAKVDVLKEVKQVQLQMLELQESLRKEGGR